MMCQFQPYTNICVQYRRTWVFFLAVRDFILSAGRRRHMTKDRGYSNDCFQARLKQYDVKAAAHSNARKKKKSLSTLLSTCEANDSLKRYVRYSKIASLLRMIY